MEDKKILLIIGAHQDSVLKLSHCLRTLEHLGGLGIDVCFSTHSSYGLDKISELCKYVCYDGDNLLLDQNDLVNSLPVIDHENISNRWSEWFKPTEEIVLRSFMSSAPHQRSALKIIKNGIEIARSEGYRWACYLEYDFPVPIVDLGELISDKISEMISRGKRSFIVWRDKGIDFMSGGFFITETSLLSQNPKFNSDWHSSSDRWFSTFGNMFFEETLEYFLSSDASPALSQDEAVFLDQVWGKPNVAVNTFSFKDSSINKQSERAFILSGLTVSFYAKNISDDCYDLELWSFNTHRSQKLLVGDFKLDINGVHSEVDGFTLTSGGWNMIARVPEVKQTHGGIFSFSCSFRNDSGSGTYTIKQTINSNDVGKLWRIKRIITSE